MAQPGFRLSTRSQERIVAEAVSYFNATISSNAIDAAADRAVRYVGDKIWLKLTRDWSGRNCKGLARLARAALAGKNWVHGKVGDLAGFAFEYFGTPRVVRLFGKEIAKRIPLPWDHQLIAVARGMQVAGIVVCVLGGRDLAQCECFIDAVLGEGKVWVGRLVAEAAKDWRNLGQLLPSARPEHDAI